MSDIIHLLPDSIANQIAAGEVVQRPASVVKELMENSIDAGASKIHLLIKEGGKTLIQVIDDGKGMSESDARLCFERHATSKLRTTEDLFNIRTLGFRGEAMASIAAVAQVELKTKRAEDETGIQIHIEGSKITKQEPVATTDGSCIAVKNLFFNVPARRNFLKSNPVELKHIIEEFQRVALANPQIAFTLTQNDLEIHNLPVGKLSQRIVHIFGKNYQKQLATVEEETELVKIHGYIGRPESAKRTRGDQYFFANNRFIKHHYLHHAVVDAFQGMLQDKMHPFYVIFMEIEPKHIDINVHPTKTEIKFDDERTIYAIMKSAIKKALGTHNLTPSIDFEQDINFGIATAGKRDYGNEKPPFEIPMPRQSTSTPQQKHNQDNWSKLYNGFDQPDRDHVLRSDIVPENQPIQETIKLGSQVNSRQTTDEDKLQKQTDITFQVQQRFIVTQVKSGMILVDQQAAHERILFEKYLAQQEKKRGASQQFLFPQQVELSMTDYALVQELNEEIKALGFAFDDFGGNTIVINGIPTDTVAGNEKELFEGFLDQFKLNKSQLKLNDRENLARSLAKKSAIKHGKKLNSEEMSSLVDELFGCENPNYAPNGNLTFVILDLDTITSYFKQR